MNQVSGAVGGGRDRIRVPLAIHQLISLHGLRVTIGETVVGRTRVRTDRHVVCTGAPRTREVQRLRPGRLSEFGEHVLTLVVAMLHQTRPVAPRDVARKKPDRVSGGTDAGS